jgi:hypothetical protein
MGEKEGSVSVLVLTIEDVLKVAFGHELVDHEPVLPVSAVAD